MKTRFHKIIGIQSGITALLSLTLFILSGAGAAFSVLAGGVAAIAPNYYFFLRVSSGAPSPDAFIRMFYLNELIKLMLTVVLFALAFTALKAQFVPLFGTYILMLAIYWFGLIYIGKSSQAYG